MLGGGYIAYLTKNEFLRAITLTRKPFMEAGVTSAFYASF
jgi:hypothetical protein